MALFNLRSFVLNACLIGVLWLCPSSAEIVETYDFTVIEKYTDDETLVLVDLDDTLFRSKTCLGSNPWWQHFRKMAYMSGLDPVKGRSFFFPYISWINQKIDVMPVQRNTPEVISRLQDGGLTVMGLTARVKRADFCAHFDRLARDHAADIGVDFSLSQVPSCEFLSEIDTEMFGLSYGIIFSQLKGKGPALMAFFEAMDWWPKRVVMIDDRHYQLESIESSLDEAGIDFVGLHYVRSRELDRSFDPGIGNIQLHALVTTGNIPSNRQAEQLRAQHPDREQDFMLEFLFNQVEKLSLY